MATIQGPGVFLAQFMRDEPPFHSLLSIGKWFANLGYKGLQIPAWDRRAIDLDLAATSKAYCDDYRGKLAELGLKVTELAGYLQGQVLAMHPAYEQLFEAFHPAGLRSSPDRLGSWGAGEMYPGFGQSRHEKYTRARGGLCLAMDLSVAQAARGFDRRCF